jgi:putative ABC transport system permease protein
MKILECFINKIPNNQLSLLVVAFKMLIHSKKKFLGMIIGTTFAAFIIMQQPAIYQGVVDQLTNPILLVSEPDLWVMTSTAEDFGDPPHISETDAYRIKAIPGVLWTRKLYRGWYTFYHPHTDTLRHWQLVAVDPKSLSGLPVEMLAGNRDKIRQSNGIIVDGYSLTQLETLDHRTIRLGDTMLADRRAWQIVGISRPLRTLTTAPKAYITSNHLPNVNSWGSFILVKVTQSDLVPKVAADINRITGYTALTQREFTQRSIKYWRHKTPILPYFIFIAALGFIIGLITMWQIFNNFILTHLHQFGMLKMLGVSNFNIINMVLFQAILTGGLGFFLGLLLVTIFGWIVDNTIITFHLNWPIALLGVLGISVIIIIASYFSILKVLRFDSVALCRDQI